MTARHRAHYFSNESHVRSPLLLLSESQRRSLRNIHGVKYAVLEIRKDVFDLKALRNTRIIEYIAEDMNLQVIPVYHLMTGRKPTTLSADGDCLQTLAARLSTIIDFADGHFTLSRILPCAWRAKEEKGLCLTRCEPHFPCAPG